MSAASRKINQIMHESSDFMPRLPSYAKQLSPLWQVIYYEGMRQNHLMFSADEVKAFEEDSSATLPAQQFDVQNNMSRLFVRVLKCSDLTSMRRIISPLPYQRKRLLYTLYRRFLETWRVHYKTCLN